MYDDLRTFTKPLPGRRGANSVGETLDAMRIGVNLTDYPWPGSLRAIARTADATGLDTAWGPDHLVQAAPGTALDDPMLEAYTALGHLAASTTRVRLGSPPPPSTER